MAKFHNTWNIFHLVSLWNSGPTEFAKLKSVRIGYGSTILGFANMKDICNNYNSEMNKLFFNNNNTWF